MSKKPVLSFSRSERPLRRPPDYSSRGVQLRLMTLVFALMLVVLLMFRAGKPESWRWLWAFGQKGDADVDTRVRPGEGLHDPLPSGAFRAVRDEAGNRGEAGSASGNKGPSTPSDSLVRAEIDGWQRTLNALERPSRNVLSKGLHAAREGQSIPVDDQPALAEATIKLDQAWREHVERAERSLEKDRRLTAEERAKWSKVIALLRDRWHAFFTALEPLSQGQPLDDTQRADLARLEELVHRVSLKRVKDDTVWRADDADAWFRLLGQLQTANAEALARRAPRVGFVQLYRQPDVYRGQLVTVSGTARRGSKIPAPANHYGIEHYYMLWIRPLAGANSPYVVYSLELPEGFPQVEDKTKHPEGTPLDEPVELTGYFFKRWAYQAQDGVRTAPLLAVKMPRWAPVERGPAHRPLPPARDWAMILAGTSLLGVAVAAFVWWQTRRPSPFAARRAEKAESVKEHTS